MEPVPGITRLGFRKWYERQLIAGHAALVTCILCMIAVAICLEEFTRQAPLPAVMILLGGVAVASVVGWKCLRYYQHAMVEAWRFGECSVCRKCETYGRFNVLSSGVMTSMATATDPSPNAMVWMNVACKKCGNIWRMPE